MNAKEARIGRWREDGWLEKASFLLAAVATTGTALGTAARTAAADDWPQVGCDTQRTGHNPHEVRIGPTNVDSLEVAWTRGVPCTINIQALVVDGVVYYGHYCGEYLAVDATTGAVLWTRSLNGKQNGHAVVDGVAYVAAHYSVYAFDALTGAALWSWDGGTAYFGVPGVADGVVLIQAGMTRTLHALDAATGAEIWASPAYDQGLDFAVDAGIVYVASGDRLEALTLGSGDLLWSGIASAGTKLSRPAVADGEVYVHSDSGGLHAFDATGCGGPTCPPLWTGTTEPTVSQGPQPPAVAEGVVYVGAGGTMYAFDAAGCGGPTCAPLWATGTACPFSPGSPHAPSVANGVVYSTCGNSYLYAFDAATGAILWQYYTKGSGYPMRSSPTIVDGWLYHPATFDFTLYAFEVPYDYDGLGAPYCFPAVPNSTGQPARITALGSDEVAENNFLLNATDMPQHQPGYFLASQTQGFVAQPPGSLGNLCLGGNIGRFVDQLQDSGVPGSFTIQVNLTRIPTYPPSTVLAGETWNFQTWFRDAAARSSNFTDGVSVVFQ